MNIKSIVQTNVKNHSKNYCFENFNIYLNDCMSNPSLDYRTLFC